MKRLRAWLRRVRESFLYGYERETVRQLHDKRVREIVARREDWHK